jgi:glyoxylase-like metal-dependent hydrolase (beta-lactamase superfamily II)
MGVETVAPGIHRISAPLGDRTFCAYVLQGPDLTVLVDTGVASSPAEALLPALERLRATPDLVVISHADYDHHGGNVPIRAAFPHARFACHPGDRAHIEDPELLIAERYGEFVPRYGLAPDPENDQAIREQTTAVPIDDELHGGERLALAPERLVEVLHTPGHSRGHLTLWDPTTRSAIVADAVLRETLLTTDGVPAFPPTYRYVDDYRQTIRAVRALGAERLLTSHFPLVEGRDEVEAFLDRTAEFVDAVEAALIVALDRADAPLTLAQLIERVGPQVGDWGDGVAFLSHPLAGHLEQLEEAGRVTRAAYPDGVPAFALARTRAGR